MQNFQDSFKTRKQSFISAFSICMSAPLKREKRGGDLLKCIGKNLINLNLISIFTKNLQNTQWIPLKYFICQT